MKNHGPAFDNIFLHQKVDLDCYVDLLFVLAFVLTGLATWHVCIGGELEKHTYNIFSPCDTTAFSGFLSDNSN